MPVYELRTYQSAEGRCPFTEWLEALEDPRTRAKIEARLARLTLGNPGDCKALGGGVVELRIDWGPGYRVYFARIGRATLLLLCGGEKATQRKDIAHAKNCLEDYQARRRRQSPGRP